MYIQHQDNHGFPFEQERPGYNPNEYTYIHGLGFTIMPEHLRERRNIRFHANVLGIALFLYICLHLVTPNFILSMFSIAFPALQYFNSRYFVPDFVYQIVMTISSAIALLVPFFFYSSLTRLPIKSALPMRKPTVSVSVPAIFICLGVSVISMSSASAVQAVFSFAGIYTYESSGSVPTEPLSLVLYLVNAAVLPAILEECFFRGAIMQSLRRYGDSFALVVSSAVFAAAHMDLSKFPFAFMMGLCIGYFTIATGSLLTGMLIHFTNNTLSVLLSVLSLSLPTALFYIINMTAMILYLLTGLIALVYLMRTREHLFQLRPSCNILSTRAKAKAYFTSTPLIVTTCVFLYFAMRHLRFAW